MLEKQFGFSSSETGVLMSCNDIGYLSCVIFAGYIARKVNSPQNCNLFLFLLLSVFCIKGRGELFQEKQLSTLIGQNKEEIRTLKRRSLLERPHLLTPLIPSTPGKKAKILDVVRLL